MFLEGEKKLSVPVFSKATKKKKKKKKKKKRWSKGKWIEKEICKILYWVKWDV